MTDTKIVVYWDYEDNLDIKLTDRMFNASRIVDGVRMYPFVFVDGQKYYLESGDLGE